MNSDQSSVDAREDHPEVDEISALTEGVLPADRTEDVRAHLADCSLCTDVRDSLDEIRGMLGRLPGPVQMPADVAGRIDAALAAEALLASTSPSDDPDGTHDTDGTDSGDTRVPAAPPATGSTRHTVSTGPARGARSGPGRSGRPPRRRWRVAVLGAAGGAAVLGFGAFFLSTLGGSGGAGLSDSADAGASAEKHASAAHRYTDDTVAPMVQDLLTRTGSNPGLGATEDQDKGTRNPLVAPGEDSAPTGAGEQLPSCVLDATERSSETPLATDVGDYKGKRVGVVVLPDRGDKQLVNVFLVDSSCATVSPSNPGTVLLERSVPRS